MAEGLFDAVKRQALLTDSVIVSYSGGKDSVVTLDLATRFFKTVHVFFMYQVAGLSFQEATLRWAEQRYGIEIYRIPHWELSHFYRRGVFCRPDPTVRPLKINDIYAHVREVFDCYWIAAGERCADSVVRNAMIKKSGSIDPVRGRFYPLAYWKNSAKQPDVTGYIKARDLRISTEARLLGHSFRSLDPGDIAKVRQHYPDDYARIKAAFPEIEVSLAREMMYGSKVEAPAVPDGEHESQRDSRAPAQPEANH